MHGFNATSDYHRIHAPVDGKVVNARIISAQHYALIESKEAKTDGTSLGDCNIDGKRTLRERRVFCTPNEPGYQFVQVRGLVLLGTKIGMVAVLPVGIAVVSSVILTAEEGITLRKGEELGYFQFGGSDIVIMFEAQCKAQLSAEVGEHYKMGVQMGTAQVVLRLY